MSLETPVERLFADDLATETALRTQYPGLFQDTFTADSLWLEDYLRLHGASLTVLEEAYVTAVAAQRLAARRSFEW